MTAAGDDAEGESPVAQGWHWSVPRGQHLPALNLRDQEEEQDGWRVERTPGRRLSLRASQLKKGREGGSALIAWHELRSCLTPSAQLPATWRGR